jgi:hypothetical protein
MPEHRSQIETYDAARCQTGLDAMHHKPLAEMTMGRNDVDDLGEVSDWHGPSAPTSPLSNLFVGSVDFDDSPAPSKQNQTYKEEEACTSKARNMKELAVALPVSQSRTRRQSKGQE